jgi:RNA polymerase sigma-70 factor (ECF subfamily)
MPQPDLKLVEAKPGAALEELSDDDLMTLVRTDRQDAFELLIRRYQTLVLGVAARYFADRALGREVAQDVFLALWAERARYRPRGKFKNYLFTVTRNRCHVVARQRKSRMRKHSNLARDTQAQPGPGGDMPLDALVEAERAREVREKLVELPERMRQVLILRFTHELALEEIASLTGMPLGTVKSHVFRGLKRLGRLLTGDA